MLSLFRRKAPAGSRLCILHAGMPKTGSTALQRFLSQHDGALARHGILYARTGRGRFRGVEHNDLMRALAGRPLFRGTEDLPQALDRELRRTPHEVLVISAEFLFSPLYFSPEPAVREFFVARGYRLEVVMYLRDQPGFLNSSYAEMVKSLREAAGFDDYLAPRLGRVPQASGKAIRLAALLDPGLADWARHEFRPYDEALRRRGIEGDFLDVLLRICSEAGLAAGFTPAVAQGLGPGSRANESCGPVQVEVCRRLARTLRADMTRLDWIRAAAGAGDIVARHVAAAVGAEPAYAGLTPRRCRRIRSVLAAGNETFARAVWGRSWDEVFPPRPPRDFVSNDPDDTGDADVLAKAGGIAAAALPEVRESIARRRAREPA